MKSSIAWIVALSLLLACGCQTPSHPQAKEQAEQRWSGVRARVKLQLGRQQYEGGLFADAAATLGEAVSLDPTNAEAYLLLARANLELSRLASAQQALDAAARLAPVSAEGHYLQGVVCEQRGELDKAIEQYRQARSLDPSQVDYLIALAECLVSADRAAEAMTLLEENPDGFDDSASVAALAGHLAALLGDDERAAAYFGRASVAAPNHAFIVEQHGLALARAGRCEQATAVLRPLAAGEDSSAAAHRALAACELRAGNSRAARDRLVQVVQRSPHDRAAQMLLAQAAIEADDFAAAHRALDALEQSLAGDPAVVVTRAACHFCQAEYAAAAGMLYDLLDRFPGHIEALRLLGEVLLHQDQREAAQDCFDRIDRLSTGIDQLSPGLP